VIDLFSSLRSAGGALDAFTQALAVTQNNVTNASTPGYAKQTQLLEAMPFDPASGIPGGVSAGEVVSARNEYAEQAVRQPTSLLGEASQNVDSLTTLQSIFDVSEGAGLSNALSNLYQAFSAWGQSPTDANARQAVIDRATDVAQAFQQTASQLDSAAQDLETQLGQTVNQINQLAAKLVNYNGQSIQGGQNDAGLDAQVNATLEQLSQYADITATRQSDGSLEVLINGQIPLVIGAQQYQLSSDFATPTIPPPTVAGAPPSAQILSGGAGDITSRIGGGQLGALVDLCNNALPSFRGNAYQAGDLNAMAKQFADCVNQILTSGNISDGPPAAPGVPLFTYDAARPTAAASTLAVDPAVTAGQLAAIDPGPPEVSNGIPLQLANLASPRTAADEIDGASFIEFYGQMASRVGSALSTAQDRQQVQQSAVAQAQSIRQQMSGVSLDEEALTVVEFQRAYEATARLIAQLDQITLDTINMLQT
jgi:flagellar hook-associated protein 1 FlgK